jgi:hypothetical protein
MLEAARDSPTGLGILASAVTAQVFFGLLVGVGAIVGGAVTLVTAVLTRRRRTQISSTYASTGGVAYTVTQFGCAGALILSGLIVIVLVLFLRRPA